MFTPRAFVETDLRCLDALITHNPFVTMIGTAPDTGEPDVTHLPVLYHRAGNQVVLEGHWAKSNPQAGSGIADAVLVVVHGPQGYVSASWYPDKEPAARVPTWNYAVAHLRGRLQRIVDEAELADLMARTSTYFEQTVGRDWIFDASRAELRRQLRGIVGFRLPVDQIDLTFKLSQNHPLANRNAVIAALQERQTADADTLATWMHSTLPPS